MNMVNKKIVINFIRVNRGMMKFQMILKLIECLFNNFIIDFEKLNLKYLI